MWRRRVQDHWLLGWTVVHCAPGPVKGWFLLSGSDLRTKCSPHHNWLARYGLLRNRRGGGAGRMWWGWWRMSRFFFGGWWKSIDKMKELSMRMGHDTRPVCPRLATGQLCCHFHHRAETFRQNNTRQTNTKVANEEMSFTYFTKRHRGVTGNWHFCCLGEDWSPHMYIHLNHSVECLYSR